MRLRQNSKFILAAAAVAAVYLFIVWWTGSGTLCVLRTYTGLPCPGCGLGHALNALLHGNLHASLVSHPLLLPLLAVLALAVWYLRSPRLSTTGFNRLWIVAAVLLTAVYLVRLALYFPEGPYPMTYSHNNLIEKIFCMLSGRSGY